MTPTTAPTDAPALAPGAQPASAARDAILELKARIGKSVLGQDNAHDL
jgi:hypothetical protein